MRSVSNHKSRKRKRIRFSICKRTRNRHRLPPVKEDSIEAVNAKEKTQAEQIVIKITDEGFVTSHGDHFHYYSGKVPFDAIFSEELILRDPTYQLQEADIVSKVKDGYIIKRAGKYYLYLKDAQHTVNVRSIEEIAQQQKGGTKEEGETGSVQASSSHKAGKGTALLCPMEAISIIFQRVPYLLES